MFISTTCTPILKLKLNYCACISQIPVVSVRDREPAWYNSLEDMTSIILHVAMNNVYGDIHEISDLVNWLAN